LGIDFGTTGLSAVLLNRLTRKFHPVGWSETGYRQLVKPTVRIPTAAYLAVAPLTQDRLPDVTAIVGTPAFAAAVAPPAPLDPEAGGILLQNFKPYLTLGIPHYSPQTLGWEPIVQWSDTAQVFLSWMQQALQSLLALLRNAPGASNSPHPALNCTVAGLDLPLPEVLQQLGGVIVGYPTGWSDTYLFNVREAILQAGLIAQPEQIFFVEDVIAAALSGIYKSTETLGVSAKPNTLVQTASSGWKGATLVVSAGVMATELAAVNLPDNLHQLTYADFSLHHFAYAGNAIDQDIVCQLLYPQVQDGALLDSLIPVSGEPDEPARSQLQQHLASSALGQNLLEAARYLKLALQEQDRCTIEVEGEKWTVTRRQLESQVFLPYIQRLNRELNALLAQTGLSAQTVNQALCTGATASLPAIARWLREKLPNATITQDTYVNPTVGLPRSFKLTTPQSGTWQTVTACSRIAYGLATLPLYPQVLDLPHQQYSSYFLLMELMRDFPNQSLSVDSVLQLLERRGINTQVCQPQILALLEGKLPAGLLPTASETIWLSLDSLQQFDAQALLSEPLFYPEGNQIYRPNIAQCNRLRQYLSRVIAGTQQKLEEPFVASLTP